jgi:ribosomal protein S27AE
MRPHEPNQLNPVEIYRPPCSKCGFLTALARIEPAQEPDHDLRTFECGQCGHPETIKIKFK